MIPPPHVFRALQVFSVLLHLWLKVSSTEVFYVVCFMTSLEEMFRSVRFKITAVE